MITSRNNHISNDYNMHMSEKSKLAIVSILKSCVRYFYQIFIFSPTDRPLKTMKNVFYFIEKALFVLEIFRSL